jgi:hypothetical protein
MPFFPLHFLAAQEEKAMTINSRKEQSRRFKRCILKLLVFMSPIYY